MTKNTTIQVTRDTADTLAAAGEVMRRIFPDLFASNGPTKDTIVGFLIGHFMSGLSLDDVEQLRADWMQRQAERN
jgi:hypothetical protein